MSEQRPPVRMNGIGEAAGTLPMLLGYTPATDDVAILALNGTSYSFSANVPDESWQGIAPGPIADQLIGPIKAGEVNKLMVFGYGEMGQVRALALKALISGLVEVEAYRVSEGQVREVDYGHTGEWQPVTQPNPIFSVEGRMAEPAADRGALVGRYGLVEHDRITDQQAAEADIYTTLLPNNAGSRADQAWAMLEDAGPGSSPLVRSRIAALIAGSVQTRDALMGYLLADGAPRQDNLEYVARTAHDSHLPQVSATAAASLFFNGGHQPVGTKVYTARAPGESLAGMVDFALESGMKPTTELRASMRTSGLSARDNPAVEESGPVPQPRASRPSIDGASGPDPSKQGPSMGLG